MRIGEFANKYDVKKTTIRYYVDKKLLYPLKKGTYQVFDQTCDKDMQLILEFRKLGFSIEEIKTLMVKRRIGNNKNESLTEDEMLSLKEKRKQIIHMQQTLVNQLKHIDDRLNEVYEDESETIGISFEMMDRLRCSCCNSPYTLSDATIKEGFIVNGQFSCDCQKVFDLKDGIIQDGKPLTYHQIKREVTINTQLENQIKNAYYFALRDLGEACLKAMKLWSHEKGILIVDGLEEFMVMNLQRLLKKDGYYYFVSPRIDELQALQKTLIQTPYFTRCLFFLMTEKVMSVSHEYFLDLSGYSSDLVYGLPWTIEKCTSIQEAAEGLFLDLGYYEPTKVYLAFYDQFEKEILYQKKYEASELLDEHDDKAFIKPGLIRLENSLK